MFPSATNSVIRNAYEIKVQQVAQGRPSLASLDEKLFDIGPKPNSLIEIAGDPNTGKSLLLWQLIARCLPPKQYGGKNCEVVLIDLGHKFDVMHFLDYIKRVLIESDACYTPDEHKHIQRRCLDAVLSLSCHSTEELDLAFDELEDILVAKPNIALVAIDTLDAFYWIDTYHKRQRMRTHYAKKVERMRELCDFHNICFAYTVNKNYLKAKTTVSSSSVNTQDVKVDYKIELSLHENGTRHINGHAIWIDKYGMHYGKEEDGGGDTAA